MATLVDSVLGVMVAYGLVMGCATALSGLIPANTVVSHWFSKRIALALTIMSTGGTIGGFIATPLVTRIIVVTDGNWRLAWFVVAAVCAVSFCCALLFVRNRPADLGQVQDGTAKRDLATAPKDGATARSGVYKTAEDWTFRDAVRHPIFWLMIFGVTCTNSAFGMIIGHGVAHLKDLGHSPGTAAMFLSIVIVTGLVGKGLFAALGDRIEPRFLWTAALIVIAVGMVLAVDARSNDEVYVTGLLLGAAAAVANLVMFTLAVNYFGRVAYPSLMGITGLFLALGPSIVIVLTGAAFDHFGSYMLAFYGAAGMCIAGALSMLLAVPPVRSRTKLQTA